jgi:hypothetical protein
LAALLLLAPVLGGVGTSTAEAHPEAACVVSLWGPVYELGTIYGGAHAIRNREADIAISGAFTKRGRVKDSDFDICEDDTNFSVSMSAPRGKRGKLWHVLVAATAAFKDGHVQRDPDSGWKRSKCERY